MLCEGSAFMLCDARCELCLLWRWGLYVRFGVEMEAVVLIWIREIHWGPSLLRWCRWLDFLEVYEGGGLGMLC